MLCEYLKEHSIPEMTTRQSHETQNNYKKKDGRSGKCREKSSRNIDKSDEPMTTSKCGESVNCQFLSVQPFPEWSKRTNDKNGKITRKEPRERKTTEISEESSSCSCNEDEIIIAVRKRVCDKHKIHQPDDRPGMQKMSSSKTGSCPREGPRNEQSSSKCKSQRNLVRVNAPDGRKPVKDTCSLHKQPLRSNGCGPCLKHNSSSAARESERISKSSRGHLPRPPMESVSSHRKRETMTAKTYDSSGQPSSESGCSCGQCSVQNTPSFARRVCEMMNPMRISSSAGPCRIQKFHPAAAVQDSSNGGSAFVGVTASLNRRLSRSPIPCDPKTSKAELVASTNSSVCNPVTDNAIVHENGSTRNRLEPKTTRQRCSGGVHCC